MTARIIKSLERAYHKALACFGADNPGAMIVIRADEYIALYEAAQKGMSDEQR